MAVRPIFWVGSSRDDIRSFPEDARRLAGHQQGLEPADAKPMQSVGPGVYEIRIHTRVEHRVFYIARLAEGIYVLHAFQKRSRKTPRREIDLARSRLSRVMRSRSRT